MWLLKKTAWFDPIKVASRITERDWALLYSGMSMPHTGRVSLICLYPEEQIISDEFDSFERKLTSGLQKYENFWVGYLSYELKNKLEKLPEDKKSWIDLPDVLFVRYSLIVEFDHSDETVSFYGANRSFIDMADKYFHDNEEVPEGNAKILSISSNMTKSEYLQNVSKFKEYILNGDIFQANLTRKFSGFIKYENPFGLFSSLNEASPAPYSSYIRSGDAHIISASPERFVKIDADGYCESIPIKGTAPRGDTPLKDSLIVMELQNSAKNKAENLMIVDLMRNDFSRGTVSGSVKVSSLFDVHTYETLHHMSSRICGIKKNDVTSLDFVKNCFPPGSMTGAPKIRAMEICSEVEQYQRGVYSGAIGWFGGDGSADLAVVIRTLLIDNDKFEFQVGGAITSDSEVESEWQETITKALGIAKCVNISKEELESI